MAETCGEPYDSADEYSRDGRIEAYYDGWGAREMAERIVELEDEASKTAAEFATELAESKRDADAGWAHAQKADDAAQEWATSWKFMFNDRARILRYRSAWLSSRRRAKRNRSYADSDLRFTRGMWSDAVRDLARYRSAWLSARRRAADEANMGQEAVDHIRRDRDRWRSGHETAEAQLVWERRENARLRSFAEEVKGVHYSTRDGEPDCAERFLKRVYDSMYELWGAEREKRQFVDRIHRRAARGEFDDVADDERETTDAPRLEHVGTEEDGGTVWRLAAGPRIR